MPDDDDHEQALRQALGRVIAMRRAELGLKRNDLRDRSGLSYPYVAELENGTKRPSSSALDALAAALELRPSELLERAEALMGGEDLLRSAPREEPRWFHAAAAPPMASAPMAMPASAARAAPRRRIGSSALDALEPGLRDAIETLVRETVREELRRAGVEPSRRRRRQSD
jgi:transcriptional regulator with XRE-family HTH domain